MSEEPGGVTIGFREIYDKVLEVGASVERLGERVERLEQKSVDEEKLEEISRTALQTARTALETATKTQNNQIWLWRTVIGGVILGGIGLLFTHLH